MNGQKGLKRSEKKNTDTEQSKTTDHVDGEKENRKQNLKKCETHRELAGREGEYKDCAGKTSSTEKRLGEKKQSGAYDCREI